MHRRLLLSSFAATATAAAIKPAFAAAPLDSERVNDAWLACLPLIEMAAARARMTDPLTKGQHAGRNHFEHTRTLVSAGDETITTPNNDTLYSNAFVDLTRGPVILTIPDAGARYLSVAVIDMFTNNNVILGARTTGGASGRWTLAGPGSSARGPRVLRIATPHAWVLARTLVDGPEDLEAAHGVQSRLTLNGPASAPQPTFVTRAAPWRDFFNSASRLLTSDPPPATTGMTAVPLILAAARSGDTAAVEEGVARAKALIALGRGAMRFEEGWQYPLPELGDYGDNIRYRAIVSVAGLGALKPSEAMYMRAAGDTGKGVFEGNGAWRLSLPRPLPVDAFWSLTMYRATDDGQFFLSENPLRRYAIGDRSRQLRRAGDGSLDVWIGRDDPGDARRSNWLPAPRSGRYAITLRAYLPKAELLKGAYRLPPLQPA